MPTPSLVRSATYWNRKLHIHVGLFLLLFIWLFAFSGLLLNHGSWKFASFWEERNQTTSQTHIQVPPNLDSSQVMGHVVQQLGIAGEVSDVAMTPDSVDFRVTVPGHGRSLHVDFRKGICTQKEFTFNVWGKLRTLHTFNGVGRGNAPSSPNWWVTYTWLVAMDGIALCLLFLCLSSWVMWYKVRRQYGWGIVALGLGLSGAVYFVLLLKLW
ncbi:hypothetical protein [Spirosoma sp. KNUC1025]|uniref:hypothetical protein n=1 Tax=Spirosoma sp. KNUC1025 TaxID=2894082 RepID=UPI001E3AD144|nr:hypothetical protein [Spirosoma sp. KNUC1025]UFH57746.1 hypothetical protein LN737_32500 [Spirosoma sp. KNUC1025]